MRYLGKMMQVLGLVVLPLSMFLELTGLLGRSFGLSQMLIMMVFGAAAFMLGRILEGFAAAPKK